MTARPASPSLRRCLRHDGFEGSCYDSLRSPPGSPPLKCRRSYNDTPCSTVAPSLAATPLFEVSAAPFATPFATPFASPFPGALVAGEAPGVHGSPWLLRTIGGGGHKHFELPKAASSMGALDHGQHFEFPSDTFSHFGLPPIAASDTTEPLLDEDMFPSSWAQHEPENLAPATPMPPVCPGAPLQPPGAPRAGPPEPLLAALMDDSVEAVHAACEEDPEAAHTVFWESDVEPPLCAAARLGCSSAVVTALLEHGADPSLVDSSGRTPLDLLHAQAWQRPQEFVETEQLLRAACGWAGEPSLADEAPPPPSPRPRWTGPDIFSSRLPPFETLSAWEPPPIPDILHALEAVMA